MCVCAGGDGASAAEHRGAEDGVRTGYRRGEGSSAWIYLQHQTRVISQLSEKS